MKDHKKPALRLKRSDKNRLDRLRREFVEASAHFLGYPCNLRYDYSELRDFLSYSINNIGDPFGDSLYRVNTHEFEADVLRFFADLFHIGRDDFWGYVTNGGTEGNMYGLYIARETCPGGKAYFSQDTHYSISKIVRVLGVPNVMVRSQENGEMDYAELESLLRADRESTPIIVCNIGTTVKGAIDSVGKVVGILDKLGIRKYYIHCDAALSGMILPFIKNAPEFDFRMPIGSIAVSGHKFIGSPVPCGAVITKKQNVDRVRRAIEYVGILDTTLSGSRNGHTPLFLWAAIRSRGLSGFRRLVRYSFGVTAYTLKRFEEIGWPAWSNKNSITVVIKRPPERIVRKWQLAVQGDLAHLVLVPHITEKQIDALIKDLKALK